MHNPVERSASGDVGGANWPAAKLRMVLDEHSSAADSGEIRRSLVVISAAFFVWGCLRSLNDLLVSHFRTLHTLRFATAMLIHSGFYSAYVISCLATGYLIQRRGYGRTLMWSAIFMALGAAVCSVSVGTDSFLLSLPGVCLLGMGVALLQTAGNASVTLLGPPETETRRLVQVQSLNALGAFIGSSSALSLHRAHIATGVGMGWIYGVLFSVALAVAVALRKVFRKQARYKSGVVLAWGILKSQSFRYAVIITFFYIGAEASLLGHAIPYLREGNPLREPSAIISVYWATVFLGRLVSAHLLGTVKPLTLLRVMACSAFFLTQVSLWFRGTTAVWLLLATGFCNASIFPSIFTTSTSEMKGHELPSASAFLSTAMFGGAVLPLLNGMLSDRYSISAAVWVSSAVYLALATGAALLRPVREGL